MQIIKSIFIASCFLFTSLAWAAVNVNSADAETLQELHGVGESKAQAIVDYRETHGEFKTAEELAEVKGIGDKTIEKNKDEIVIK